MASCKQIISPDPRRSIIRLAQTTALMLAWLCGTALAEPQPRLGDEEVASPVSQDSVRVSDAGLLDVHLRETQLTAALEMLSYQARTNIVATRSVSGSTSANLYQVTLDQALEAILTPSNLVHKRQGNVILVGTREELAGPAPPPQSRVFDLRYISREEAAAAVQPLLSAQGKTVLSQPGVGGSPSESYGAGGAGGTGMGAFRPAGRELLIVVDEPERLEACARLIAEIDQRPQQVLIEATILRATLSDQNRLGIDFTLLGGVDFRGVTSTSDSGTNLRTGALPERQFEETTLNVNTNLIGGAAGTGFTFGIIRNNIAVFLNALEEVTDVTVVANPKVVALNRQEAEVIVGRRDGYLTTTVTQTAAVQTVEFLETGTQIRLRPTINADGTVRLEVRPKDSNGGLTAANLPFEETTEAHAHLMVDDGGTVLIGGLFRERSVNSKAQAPVVGDIPLLGALVQRTNDATVREEVIILLTVRVLKNTSAERAEFAALLDDIERVRVGSRRGLMATGRERLAQAFFQEALKQSERGHDCAALLNVRMALHNHPRHLPALKLKEELLGRRLWDSDGTRVRTILAELLRSDESVDPPPPRLGRPARHEELLTSPGPAEDAE